MNPLPVTLTSPLREDKLFSLLSNTLRSYSGLSGTALSRGIELYQKGIYSDAVREFRRAIAFDPYSENSLKAYDFMAQAYLKMKRPEEAIKVYEEAIRLFFAKLGGEITVDFLYLKIGNILYDQQRYNEAMEYYLKAVRINPSTDNLYPLGQAYIQLQRYKEAEETFQRILRYEPDNYGAHYSLGLLWSKQGIYGEAIKAFKRAIEIKRDFAYAYYDLGIVYTDVGEFEKADEQVKILEGLDSALALELWSYIYRKRRPRIRSVNTLFAFDMKQGPGTPLSSLDPALSAPGSSKDFRLIVYFDKEMDRGSVEDIFNWSISWSMDMRHGGPYNWGLPLPKTEVRPYPVPKMVIYDSTARSATVYFTLRQNQSGDGTIDPSHLVFRFYGRDAYGNTVDPDADEYTGLSLIV